MSTQATATLTALILAAAEHLDPGHQGVHWPDPIAWDGRSLTDQASDLCVLLDAAAHDGDEYAASLSTKIAACCACSKE